jgi:hypothetical protein
MRDYPLNPTATREWLRNSEELLIRITDGLATTQRQIARSRGVLNASPSLVRRGDDADARTAARSRRSARSF